MSRYFVSLFLGALLFLGSGCREQVAQLPKLLPAISLPAIALPTSTIADLLPASPSGWQRVETGADRLEFTYGTSSFPTRLIVYRFDPSRFSFRFEQATSPRAVEQWSREFPSAVLVMNGVYFHDDYLPSGAFVTKKHQIGERSFDEQKSAVLELSPSVRVVDTSVEHPVYSSYEEAAQTYPMFIKNGIPAIREDSGYVARRSFAGVDRKGNVYFGIAVGEPPSLYGLMRHLQELPITWKDVVNLDGGPSTGLVARFSEKQETLDSLTVIPNVVVVERVRR